MAAGNKLNYCVISITSQVSGGCWTGNQKAGSSNSALVLTSYVILTTLLNVNFSLL